MGRGFGLLGVGGPWLALGFQEVESLQTLTSALRGPMLAVGWARVPARPGLKGASLGNEVYTLGTLHFRILGDERLQVQRLSGVIQPSQDPPLGSMRLLSFMLQEPPLGLRRGLRRPQCEDLWVHGGLDVC